jgi:hypothetical protein
LLVLSERVREALWLLIYRLTAMAGGWFATHLGCPGFEEPVKAEAPGFADFGLELIPRAIAQLVDHAQNEAILLLCTPNK